MQEFHTDLLLCLTETCVSGLFTYGIYSAIQFAAGFWHTVV